MGGRYYLIVKRSEYVYIANHSLTKSIINILKTAITDGQREYYQAALDMHKL